MCQETLSDTIRQLVINDYVTPSIKAEVILDTLLTPYVDKIVNRQLKLHTVFVAKEMSIFEEKEHRDNRGAKIDYVLADESAVYLAELKTTDSSIDQTQANRYSKYCKDRTFGEVFGRRLLEIVRDSFAETYRRAFLRDCGEDPDSWDDGSLAEAFHLVFRTRHLGKKYQIEDPSRAYARAAAELIKAAGWTQSEDCRSRKYLYTLGQLMDYMHPDHGDPRPLWRLPLKLLYITPAGSLPHPEPERHDSFYLGSVSLVEAGEYLAGKEDDLAQLLANILKEIYPTAGKQDQRNLRRETWQN